MMKNYDNGKEIYKSLIFDPDSAYQGEYTVKGNSRFPGEIVFKTYQVTYITNTSTGKWATSEWRYPYTGESVEAAEFHKMNIKVPVSYDGVPFNEAALADAPILFSNPWGGDKGSPVGNSGAVSDSDCITRRALLNGWVVVEPGMRGTNCTSGTPGTPDYINCGKLPNPIVDLKAALRYLRYENNATAIPGDKDKIFALGTSSGGCGTVILASSGNTHMYDAYLDEIGAAPGRDDVFAAVPSCPVSTRAWGDVGIAWERWGDLSSVTDAHLLNAALCAAFPAYQASLGLTAEFAVGDSIAIGDLLKADNLAEYLMVYVKQSAVKYLNSLGSKAAIDAYLASSYTGPDMYRVPNRSRSWIKPIYDTAKPGLVVDIDNTWQEFWTYVFGTEQINPANQVQLQYDKAFTCPNIQENGILLYADKSYANPSSPSFGKSEDYAAVYSEFGWDYIKDNWGIDVSDEYRDLITFQRNSVDPLYFILGYAGECTVCNNWFLRTGAIDIVTPHPIFFNLATALENQGKNVDAALIWDQSHAETSDIDKFFEFAYKAVKNRK